MIGRGLDAAWRLLCAPPTLPAALALALALALVALLLPQMPGQLNDAPTSAERWLTYTSAEYGIMGALLRPAGFFNLLHSPLFRLLLLSIGLILLVQIGETLGSAWMLRRLPEYLTEPTPEAGHTLLLPSNLTAARLRTGLALPPASAQEALRTAIGKRYPDLQEALVPVASGEREEGVVHEHRLLALRSPQLALLRPLLPLGLLLALFAVWRLVTGGWEIVTPLLAPGESYRYAAHDLDVRYTLSRAEDAAPPAALLVTVGSRRITVPITAAQTRAGPLEVRVLPGAPALLVREASGRAALLRPGQSEGAGAVGLVFPSLGSEESLLLPEAGAGLRMVRLLDVAQVASGQDAFLIEIYSGDESSPTERVQINATEQATLTVGAGTVEVDIQPALGLNVVVRFTPLPWLPWLALPLLLLGGVGYWRRPGFLLTQTAPWRPHDAVLVAQSDRRREIDALTTWIRTLQPQEAKPTDDDA